MGSNPIYSTEQSNAPQCSMKKIEKIEMKHKKVAKGETVISVMLVLADEMVVIKNKLNEIIDVINKEEKTKET